MIRSLVLIAALVQLPTHSRDVGASPVDARAILDDCDRLVLARVKRMREFKRSAARPESSIVRVAELEVVDAPFGSVKEKVFVRLPEQGAPPDLALWPLGQDLRLCDADWDDLPRIEKELLPDALWFPSIPLQGPWPVYERKGARRVSIPVVLVLPKSTEAGGPPTKATMELDLEPVMTAVESELERTVPRIEASIATTGAGCWGVDIDAWKHGRLQCGSHASFEWNDAQRARWQAALDAARFSTLPAEIGASRTPCASIDVLSLVTREGRQTVRIMGSVVSTPEERAQLDRAQALWNALHELIPEN